MRRAPAAALALLVAAGLAGCGADEPSTPATDAASPVACADGQIRFLQGAPTDLPGGGSAGIGQVDEDADPMTVRLVLGGAQAGETADDLAVGDSFTVRGASYKIVCISAGKVTADPLPR